MTEHETPGAWSRGEWLSTVSGRRFPVMEPTPDDIHLEDIAHALGMQCRYNGHVKRFYSVAEHCILMARAATPENALWALLHDAAEAYVGDMIRPIKRHLPEFSEIEDRVLRALAQKFGLPEEIPEEVHILDNRILLTERSALLHVRPGEVWGPEHLEPLDVDIHAWSPGRASARFLKTFWNLQSEAVWPTPRPSSS